MEVVRKILKMLVILGLTFLGVKFILSFKTEPQINELTESIKLVKIQRVELDTNSLSVEVYGNLKSLNEIDVFPEVGGRLQSENFREGNKYSKGQVIASIENKELANNLKSQKSNLLNQVAKLVADLKFDFPDAITVWESFLESIQFDAPLPELPQVSDVKLKKYLAGKNIYNTYFAIEAQEARLAKYTIIAPFDGVLTEALIKPGTVVRVGQKIGRFMNPTQFELEASISLANGNKIAVGDAVVLRSNDVSGTWVGSVSRINRTLSESSQNMDVFIGLNSRTLFNGMYLNGQIAMGTAPQSMIVNRSLIDGSSIFRIVDGKLLATEVQVLQINEEDALIAGLNEGDMLLGDAINGAYTGMKVRYKGQE